jgi:hypothetical protein
MPSPISSSPPLCWMWVVAVAVPLFPECLSMQEQGALQGPKVEGNAKQKSAWIGRC